MMQSRGRTLRFLANVDPIDVARALNGLDPEETMAVVISKTFTTAETMLNARTVRSWLTSQLGELAWRASAETLKPGSSSVE
jgi:glucose-6-phosphate isomerase